MMKFALSPVALLLGSGVLLGQTTEILGPRNSAFLEGLWRSGYIVEADRIGQLVAASNLPAAEKEIVGTLHTRLQIAVAAQSGDAKQRRDLVLKVIADKAAQIAAAPAGSDTAVELVNDWIEQFRLLADAVSEALGQESDLSAQTKMREEAEKHFLAAEVDLQERKKTYEKLRKEDEPATDVPFLVAFYGLGKVYYFHGLIFPADAPGGRRMVQQSLETLEEFDLEFGDSLAAFEAKLTTALCHHRLGDIEQALGDCDDAIALRERFEPRAKDGTYPVDRNAADVIAVGVVQKTMFLKDQKEHAKILEAAKDYFDTIPQALEAAQGPGVLAAQAEAHMDLGETAAATAAAQRLQEIDPRGRWGYRGQELLAKIITSGAGEKVVVQEVLKIAESLAAKGEFEQALRICRETVLRSKGPEDEKYAAQALLITGAILANRKWFHEASVAFDAVVRRFPKAEVAPDALWRSVQCFIELDDTDGLPMFKRLIEERSNQLVREYPTDVHVAHLQLVAGQRLDKGRKYLEAAAVFERIGSDSSVHLDARYYASNCYQRHARVLQASGQEKEAKPFADKALEGFRTVLQDIETVKPTVADAKVKGRIEVVEFSTRVALANLFLTGGGSPAEADKVLQSIVLKDDDNKAPMIWGLRIRSKLAQGNIEEATSDMDAALSKFGSADALLATCRALATSLDNLAVERNKAKDRTGARTLWSKAQSYYLRSSGGASEVEVAQIAERLMVIGMVVNEIDEKVEGWFEVPDFQIQSAEAWQSALELSARLGERNTYKTRISRARILGLMSRWGECEAELAQLFADSENKKILGANKRLESTALSRRPELLSAYLEWGFALSKPVAGGDEKARRARATDIFNRVGQSVPDDSKHWWHARYGQIQSLFDRGLYEEASVSMGSLDRTNPDLDGGRFALQQRFRTLKVAIQTKTRKK